MMKGKKQIDVFTFPMGFGFVFLCLLPKESKKRQEKYIERPKAHKVLNRLSVPSCPLEI